MRSNRARPTSSRRGAASRRARLSVRREVRRAAGPGTARGHRPRSSASLADALTAIVEALPDEAFALPGGEEDWNVAQCIGHDCEARVGLCLAASLAARDAGRRTPRRSSRGSPARRTAIATTSLRKIAQSQRLVERVARDGRRPRGGPVPARPPQVGRLRCGEWLLFAGVHDLMHLEQLDEIRAGFAGMSPFRPDLVDCWIFRDAARGREILLLRRAPGRILPGLWQCVSGSLEDGERVAAGALRELREETGFDADAIEAFYDLDLVNQFHEPSVDAVVTAAVFAVRVAARRRADAVARARRRALARRSTRPIARSSGPATGRPSSASATTSPIPERAAWFELDLDGRANRRPIRAPRW